MTACELCGGSCCKSFTLPVELFDREDINTWLGYHADEVKNDLRFNKPCKMLCSGRCSIYDTRPKMCREYEVGSESCKNAIKRFAPEKYQAVVSIIQQSLGGAK